MESTTPTSEAPTEKKSWFETVVISTPVLLTVIATFMVGQSSAEMTYAQYYRSVAGQNQSKAGDQWGFFQAKRIRGQILEGNADALMAQPRDPFTRDTLPDAAQQMVTQMQQAKEKIKFSNNQEKFASLTERAEKLRAVTKSALNPPNEGWQGNNYLLKPDNVQAALDALRPKFVKKSKTAPIAGKEKTAQAILLDEAINDIKSRKPESEIANKVLKLTDETLNDAIKDAESRADEVARRGKRIENVLEEFDSLVDQQTELAFDFQQKFGPSADAIRTSHAKLQGDYKAARHAYSARRYEDDARSNQDSAYLYEVMVRLSSARSDKHLFRSKMYLYAMLVAQVGVTIASLALAVKRKSIFWLLAALTGAVAIAFGAYVYLDMPLPSF